jgi:hypothetical protein
MNEHIHSRPSQSNPSGINVSSRVVMKKNPEGLRGTILSMTQEPTGVRCWIRWDFGRKRTSWWLPMLQAIHEEKRRG